MILIVTSDDESEFETSDSEYYNTASETVSEVSVEAAGTNGDIKKVNENGENTITADDSDNDDSDDENEEDDD